MLGLQGITIVPCPLRASQASSLCVITAFPLCPCFLCVQISPFYKDISHIGLGPTLMISFKFNHFFKELISKCHYIWRYKRSGFQHTNLAGDTSQPCVAACSVSQSCWLFGNPRMPGSSVHGILQAGILGWVSIFSSKGSSRPRDRTQVSCIGRQILYHCITWEALQLNHKQWSKA